MARSSLHVKNTQTNYKLSKLNTMKRFLMVLAAVLITATAVQAQGGKYHGEIYIGGGYGIGKTPASYLQAHTVHGAIFGNWFALSLGTGVDLYTNDFAKIKDVNEIKDGKMMVPVFADIKFYIPTRSKFDPFFMFDGGYTFEAKDLKDKGLMVNAGLGFKAGAFALSVGYHVQQLGKEKLDFANGAVQLRLGFSW